MECLEDIRKIIDSHLLEPIKLPEGYKNIYHLIREIPEVAENFKSIKDDFYFIKKYSKYISKGHYGFSIGNPVNPEWNETLDEILEYCIKKDPKFEIQQIKVKFGYICFYTTSEVIEDLTKIEILILKKLNDKALIW